MRGCHLINSQLLLFLLFQNSSLMVYAKESTDCQTQFSYGEPTVFVIKRVKNQTDSQTLSRRTVSWGPTAKFEPYYRNEWTVLILLVLICLIFCTVFGNGLVVAAQFLERSLQVWHTLLLNSHRSIRIMPQDWCPLKADIRCSH